MTTLTFSGAAIPAAPARWFEPLRYLRQLWRNLFGANHYIALAICSQVLDEATEESYYRTEAFYYQERRRLHVGKLVRVWQLITGDETAKREVVTDTILELLFGTVYVDEESIYPGTRLVQAGGSEVVHLFVIMADHVTSQKLREPAVTALQPLARESRRQPKPAEVESYLRQALAA